MSDGAKSSRTDEHPRGDDVAGGRPRGGPGGRGGARGGTVIRTVYLYLFAVLGLVLVTIGGVGSVDMLLKGVVFRRADDEGCGRKIGGGSTPSGAR